MPAILIDGQPDAQISPWDRGFQYGDGIFETIAVIQGEPLFWAAHFERLSRCARELALPEFPEKVWLEDIQALLRPDLPRQVMKLLLSRGPGDRGYAFTGLEAGTRVVYATDWPTFPRSHWQEGIVVGLCETPLIGGAPFTRCKTLNRLNQIVARQELNSRSGLSEGLMLDHAGMLREGTFTNLFWVREGRVETPKLDVAGITGIMRQEIIRWLTERQIPVFELDASPAILAEATECFISNSLIGIWPVSSVEGVVNFSANRPLSDQILSWLETISLVEKAE